jgi:ketosteroid isomerase-like protein
MNLLIISGIKMHRKLPNFLTATTKGDVRDHMMETGVEAADDVVDEVFVRHRCAEAGKAIRHDLHAGAVVEDGEVALVEVAELGAEVDDAVSLLSRKRLRTPRQME